MIISMENCLLLSIALADIDLRSFSSVINSFICLIYSDISSLGIANPLTLSVIMSVMLAKLLQKSEMRKDIVIELSYKGFG